MSWQHVPFALPSLAAAMVLSILVICVWRRRPAPGAGARELIQLKRTEESLRAKEAQLRQITKEVGLGTGLGLATCFGIVKENKGYIEVESELHKGSTFRIYLPYVAETAAVKPKIGENSPAPGGNETILLVEDEPAVRNMTTRILEERGYTVLKAANGAAGLRIVQTPSPQQIDMVLTDLVMPQMGGKELAEQIRRTHPHVKVLFMSGYVDSGLYQHGLPKPGSAFLSKPFTPNRLIRKIREVLDAP